jgi:hypothetical protein
VRSTVAASTPDINGSAIALASCSSFLETPAENNNEDGWYGELDGSSLVHPSASVSREASLVQDPDANRRMAISLLDHLAKFDLKALVDVIQRNEWFLVPDLAHRIGGALDSVVTLAKRKLDQAMTVEESTAKKAKALQGDTVISGILGTPEGKAM